MLKRNNICLPVNNSIQQTTSTHETGIFTWATLLVAVSSLRNKIPEPWQDIIPVTNVRELKTASLLLSILFLIFFLAALYDSVLLQEGGAL